MRDLQFAGESEEQYRDRAERAARHARILVDAALDNRFVKQFIADPKLPHTKDSERGNPTVRIEYEQGVAIGGISECLRSTRSKNWGDGPYVVPLEPDDPVDPFRILYHYKKGSLPNRRFEQRRRMKELLGKRYRLLVKAAKYKHMAKSVFLAELSDDQARPSARFLASRREIFGVQPGALSSSTCQVAKSNVSFLSPTATPAARSTGRFGHVCPKSRS